jgi:hypothetical protein
VASADSLTTPICLQSSSKISGAIHTLTTCLPPWHILVQLYVVLPKNSGNLNRVPKPVVICRSATICG